MKWPPLLKNREGGVRSGEGLLHRRGWEGGGEAWETLWWWSWAAPGAGFWVPHLCRQSVPELLCRTAWICRTAWPPRPLGCDEAASGPGWHEGWSAGGKDGGLGRGWDEGSNSSKGHKAAFPLCLILRQAKVAQCQNFEKKNSNVAFKFICYVFQTNRHRGISEKCHSTLCTKSRDQFTSHEEKTEYF